MPEVEKMTMAASVTGISSMATRGILRELAAAYEKACGRSVTIESVGGVDAAHRVRAREPFDVVLLASDVLARLATEQYVLSGSRASFARSSMAIAVGEGAVRIPIENEAAVRQASLNARAIGYSTGPSGDHLLRLWDRWGIREHVMQRAIRAVPGQSVASLLATGQVELGFQQVSELLHQPGIRILGPMPMEIEKTTIFAAGITVGSRQRHEAADFISFLASPETAAAKYRYGLEPG